MEEEFMQCYMQKYWTLCKKRDDGKLDLPIIYSDNPEETQEKHYEEVEYINISMPGGVKVMVPRNQAAKQGLRNIISQDEVERVFCILETDETAMSDNWNKRYRDNMDKMKSGDIYEVADVVRNLSFKQKEKGLSTGEKKMLNNAKQILVSELVLAERSSYEEMENIVDNKINQSFKEFRIDEESPLTNMVNKFIPFNQE